MQNAKHVPSSGCHIKVRREFRGTTSCSAFNLPRLHLSVKLLFPHLRYLRGEKKKTERLRKEDVPAQAL